MKPRERETRYMWTIVLFDLPVGTKAQRRAAARFRVDLKKAGFIMLQFSVYARVSRGDDGAERHLKMVSAVLPPEGSVRMLVVTDNQFSRMRHLVGTPSQTEEAASCQLILL